MAAGYGNNFTVLYPNITTASSTASFSVGYYAEPTQLVPTPKPAAVEDEVAWLRRRVREVTDLIAA